MTKPEEAVKNFTEGCNCAQAVLLAYAGEAGLSRETALLLASSFGGGMGRLREVCGALAAAFMVAGLKYGYTDVQDAQKKAAHYARIQALAARFKERHGSILCRDLLALPAGPSAPLPEARTAAYYSGRPCARLVRSAAEMLEDDGAGEAAR